MTGELYSIVLKRINGTRVTIPTRVKEYNFVLQGRLLGLPRLAIRDKFPGFTLAGYTLTDGRFVELEDAICKVHDDR